MLSQTFWRSVCHSTRTGIAHRVIRPGSGLLRAFSSPAEAAADQEVVITERCAARINMLKKEDPDLCLRIEIDGGGCQGFQYNFKLDKMSSVSAENDRVFTLDDAMVVIDESSMDVIKGSRIDYKSDLIGSAFTVGDNPHAEATCGCKRSFTIK